MKVTRDMLKGELRKGLWVKRLLGPILGQEWLARLMLGLSAKSGVGTSIPGLNCDERVVPSQHGGRDLRIRIYKPARGRDSLTRSATTTLRSLRRR